MDEIVRALDVLSALVRNCYGPCAEEALLFSPPDPPVVTADGHALLVAWRRGLRENRSPRSSDRHEPMQTLLLDAAESLYLQIGDGSSEFVLLLHGAVIHAVDAIRLGRLQWGRAEVSFRQLATAFGALRRECEQLLINYAEWQPDLRVTTAISFTTTTDGKLRPSTEFHETIVTILQSGLSGLLGEHALDFLVQLVVEWLFTPPLVIPHADNNKVDAQLLFKRVQHFLKRASDMVTFALASSLIGSHVVPPDEFILRKSLVPSQMPSMLSVLKTNCGLLRFVCFTCALSLTEGANHVTICTQSDAELFSAADTTRLFITNFLSTLRTRHDVRLLVCTEQLEDSMVAICTRLGIACVQYAEKDDVFDLCAASGAYPLASLFDEIHDGRHVGTCRGGATSVRLQQSAGLWFHGLVVRGEANDRKRHDSRDVDVVVPQLVLKAPTKGVYKQYFKVVVKALRILASWWKPSAPNLSQCELYGCRGGGATELAIARHLDAQQHIMVNATRACAIATQQARKIFANALRDVVVVLRSNMGTMAVSPSIEINDSDDDGQHYSSRTSKRVVLQGMARLALHNNDPVQQPALYGYVLNRNHSVETLGGAICIPQLEFCDPKNCGLLHPWQRIDSLIFHTLQTLEQLFRVDCIIPTTTTAPHKTSAAS